MQTGCLVKLRADNIKSNYIYIKRIIYDFNTNELIYYFSLVRCLVELNFDVDKFF